MVPSSAASRTLSSISNRAALAFLALALLAISGCGHTEATAQAPPPQPPLTFIGEWGTRGSEPGQLSHPEWLSTDFAGNVFIADSGSGYIQKFTAAGHPLLAFNDRVPGDPFRVVVDSGAGIYVLGRNADSIFLFSPEGEAFRQYPLAPVKAHQRPVSLAVDDPGDIFVIVSVGAPSGERGGEHREIREYNTRGRYRKTLVPAYTAGETFVPASLAASSEGHLYVLDATSTRVQKFTLDGDFVAAWNSPPAAEPAGRAQSAAPVSLPAGADGTSPAGVGIGVSSQYVFTPDSVRRGVLAWTLDGQPKFGDLLGSRLQVGGGRFQIAASPRGDLLVLDIDGSRVLRFHVNNF